jgi:hypothetical protein
MVQNRTLRLQMKKGMAVIKECTQIPLKENCLLHTNEYTFFCNSTTFNRLQGIYEKRHDEPGETNLKLEQFFLKSAKAANIMNLCYDLDRALDELKADMLIGGQQGNYNDHWQEERDENILKQYRQSNLQRKSAGMENLKVYTAPNNMYKAMVDPKEEAIEFVQFEEAMSALKQKNVMAEHVNINRRPMYVLHKILALVFYMRDVTGNPTWGE